ncbi:MAG TPA: hypothetical protein VH062_36495 [Polyangiaceae bacterium]|jgi:hypothetical protein|nr:hypothetical protein [Polyangiaceae bacterium]
MSPKNTAPFRCSSVPVQAAGSATRSKPAVPADDSHHIHGVRDLLLLVVIPDFPYPILKFLGLPFPQIRLAHVAVYLYSESEGVSHLLEWGLYHPTRRREGAVRSYRLGAPQFDAEGNLCVSSLADLCQTISGLEKRLPLRGSVWQLDPGAARPAVEIAKAWAKRPPRYHFRDCSCKTFGELVLASIGDISGFSGRPWIRSWQGSADAPSFEYDPRHRQLKWTLSPAHPQLIRSRPTVG